jgi:hypothetical protein
MHGIDFPVSQSCATGVGQYFLFYVLDEVIYLRLCSSDGYWENNQCNKSIDCVGLIDYFEERYPVVNFEGAHV